MSKHTLISWFTFLLLLTALAFACTRPAQGQARASHQPSALSSQSKANAAPNESAGAAGPGSGLVLSKEESLKLENAQLRGQLAQAQQGAGQCQELLGLLLKGVNAASGARSAGEAAAADAALSAAVGEIKRSHGWGDEVRFDPRTLRFSAPEKPAEKKP